MSGISAHAVWRTFKALDEGQKVTRRALEKVPAEAFTVEAELPGMNRDDVKVTVHDGVLTIQGERKSEEETKDKKLHRIERFYGSFMRRFTLPDNVDENSVKANFKDGLLTLTIQKAEPKEPKAIEVEVQ
ncbi:Hsp20/alpha crystallin family protein [Marinobacter shengliensis]